MNRDRRAALCASHGFDGLLSLLEVDSIRIVVTHY